MQLLGLQFPWTACPASRPLPSILWELHFDAIDITEKFSARSFKLIIYCDLMTVMEFMFNSSNEYELSVEVGTMEVAAASKL